ARCPHSLAEPARALDSMRQQHRHGGVGENVLGGPAEDHLPQPALSVSAFDDEITTQCLRLRQYDLAGTTLPGGDRHDLGAHAVPQQVAGDLLAGRSRHSEAFDRAYDDATG